MPFSRHPVVIFCQANHRFAKRRSVRLVDLEGERFILRENGSTTRKALELAFEEARIQLNVVMEVSSREIIREAVLQGLGIAAVSLVEYVPGPGLHMVKISDAEIHTYAHVLCLAERRETRMVREFLDTITPGVAQRREPAPEYAAVDPPNVSAAEARPQTVSLFLRICRPNDSDHRKLTSRLFLANYRCALKLDLRRHR